MDVVSHHQEMETWKLYAVAINPDGILVHHVKNQAPFPPPHCLPHLKDALCHGLKKS